VAGGWALARAMVRHRAEMNRSGDVASSGGGGYERKENEGGDLGYPMSSLIILDSCCRAGTIKHFQRFDSFQKQILPSYKRSGAAPPTS